MGRGESGGGGREGCGGAGVSSVSSIEAVRGQWLLFDWRGRCSMRRTSV